MTIAMKKLFITIMGLLVVLSCGQKPNSSSDDVSDEPIDDGTEEVEATKPLELKTYTFSDTLGMAHVDISIEFPVKGEKKLVNAIRRYLSDVILQESDEADQADGKSLADHHGKFHMERMKELAAQYEGDDYVTEVFYDWSFIKHYEDDHVVTFLTLTSLYEGGIHGIGYQEGVTFFKKNGQRFDYNMLKGTDSDKFMGLLREGLRQFFSPNKKELIDDTNLAEELVSIGGLDEIPLPNADPYITSEKGIHFIYQPYEVSYYAAGKPEFDIPMKDIRPFLTKKAKSLLED